MFNRFYSKFGSNSFLNILEDIRFAYISTSFTSKHGLRLSKHFLWHSSTCSFDLFCIVYQCPYLFHTTLIHSLLREVCFIKRSPLTIVFTNLLAVFHYLVKLKLWFWLGRFWSKASASRNHQLIMEFYQTFQLCQLC